MLYVPGVAGAVKPTALYCASVLVIFWLSVIGEVAVNVIVPPPNGVDVLTSVKVPDKLYLPPGSTADVDGEIPRVKEVVCLTE